ncbi:hypothetical protein TNCV_2119241 [Trichonephila clavipes]|nr:hypothetical protein TNCV_2119241 [Trichonephila clavipes]
MFAWELNTGVLRQTDHFVETYAHAPTLKVTNAEIGTIVYGMQALPRHCGVLDTKMHSQSRDVHIQIYVESSATGISSKVRSLRAQAQLIKTKTLTIEKRAEKD